ncbi:helix-turn-helix domain-containing protein [Polymorphospora rubra]|uniref:helix-turn-helix domain-containing protein n=1 Tax=Polymorphospora rubra TaxID=338584 RepID=UPI003401914E
MIVTKWTAREVAALRSAYRMTQEAMAHKLGIAVCTVTRWEKGRNALAAASQAALDELLRRADDDQRARFLALLDDSLCQDGAVGRLR